MDWHGKLVMLNMAFAINIEPKAWTGLGEASNCTVPNINLKIPLPISA